GLSEMTACLLGFTEFLQNGSQVRMGKGVFRRCLYGTLEAVGGSLEISLFVVQGSAVNQGFYHLRLQTQGLAISVNGVGRVFSVVRAFEGAGEPLLRSVFLPGDDADLFLQLAGFEIQEKLARQRIKTRATPFDDDIPTVGKNAQFGKG